MIGFFLIKDPYRSSIQIDLRIQSWSDHGLLTGTSTPLVFRLDVRGMNQWTSCRSPKNLINLTAWNYNEIGGARFIPGVTDSKILGISDGASSSDPPILQGIGTVHYERLRNWRRTGIWRYAASIVLQVSCGMLWVGTYLQDSTNLIHLKALDSVAVFSWRDRTSDTLVMTSCKWFWHINYQFERSTSSQWHRKSHLGSVLISMSERRELDGPIEVGCLNIFKWFECHIDLFATCAGWI